MFVSLLDGMALLAQYLLESMKVFWLGFVGSLYVQLIN